MWMGQINENNDQTKRQLQRELLSAQTNLPVAENGLKKKRILMSGKATRV